MQLTVWTYEGPPHVGAMRIATAMQDLHYVLHAPQGDTYADLLFTMIERRAERPPVTYTTFQARDLGADTAELFQTSVRETWERFQPKAMIVGASCTAELIQDDPGGLAEALDLPIPVIPLELPSYQRKENWGASETFYQIVRALHVPPAENRPQRLRPSCNLLGPTALGFRHRDDVEELRKLLDQLGIDINVVAPWNATPADIARLADADFNVVMYPEIADTAARWLKRMHGQPFIDIVPIGVAATREFIEAVAELTGVDPAPVLEAGNARLPWYSRSIDSTYLTGKRVFIFGDATHALAAARIAREELAFEVVGLGTYSREFARDVRAAAKELGVDALITDDYLDVEACVTELQPELVLGTQMERHIAKRLGIGCAVISAPVHVQDYPAAYSPQMGFEGANTIFDTWVHPLMMGLEEHLLGMFSEDFEFSNAARPSHLGGGARIEGGPAGDRGAESTAIADRTAAAEEVRRSDDAQKTSSVNGEGGQWSGDARETSSAGKEGIQWSADAQKTLSRIPFFVRGKARRNTETYARERGIETITSETLYDAKAHFGR